MKKLTPKQLEVFAHFEYFYNAHEDCLEKNYGFQQEIKLVTDDEIKRAYKEFKRIFDSKQRVREILIKKTEKNYMCFITDGDGHWYKIPVSQRGKFEKYRDSEDDDSLDDKFYDYRCEHPSNYMFEKIEELKESK